jgi:hypothetical protein
MEAGMAVANLLAGSATFRRIYAGLFNVHASRVNVTIRQAATPAEFAKLKNTDFGAAYAERESRSPNGRIVFFPPPNGGSQLEGWLAHEIAHSAGQFAEESGAQTGVSSSCGGIHPGSSACVAGIEDRIRTEMEAWRARQASSKQEGKP